MPVRKSLCASSSTQMALRKLLCASLSANTASRKQLCASWLCRNGSVQLTQGKTALRKLRCASCTGQAGSAQFSSAQNQTDWQDMLSLSSSHVDDWQFLKLSGWLCGDFRDELYAKKVMPAIQEEGGRIWVSPHVAGPDSLLRRLQKRKIESWDFF